MSYSNGPKISTDGLVLCLDANNPRSYPGNGNIWHDVSGNGKNFTWDTADWTNGYFNTYTNSTYKRATGPASNSFGIDNASGYTIFFVFQTNTGSSNGAFKFKGSGLPSGTRGIFCHPGWTGDTIYFDQGGCCASNQRISYYNANINDSGIWQIVGLRSTVATRSILYNGSQVVNTTTTAANINLDSNAVLLNPGDEGYGWNAKLAYFAVYNRGISNDEYVQNYKALKGRFNL
jgi:hypothetical protein